MKKILSIALCVLMLVTALTACGEKPADKPATLKFGAGVQSAASTVDVTAEKDGSGALDASFAAVLVDADGKIVACELDAAKMETKFSADNKVTPVADKDLKSKYEQGAEYAMKNEQYGSKREWFEHADILEKQIIGKTIDEVKALVVNNYQGNADVMAAGCTIGINDLILAVEKAVANATVEVAADAKLSIGFAGQQAVTEASAEKNAGNKLTANVFIAAVDAAGKVLACSTDCVEYSFSLKDGKVSGDTDNRSKRQKGAEYGMKSEYGSKKEWFEHADAFDAACVGKTASEIAGLMLTEGQHAGRGIDSLQAVGCTIYVSGFVAAAAKI